MINQDILVSYFEIMYYQIMEHLQFREHIECENIVCLNSRMEAAYIAEHVFLIRMERVPNLDL